MSKETLREFLTEDEFAEFKAKVVELRQSIENAKKDANNRHAFEVLLITAVELQGLLERFSYARDYHERLSEA